MDSLLWLGSPDCVSHVGLFLNRVDFLQQTVLQGWKALSTLGEAGVSGYPSQVIWRQKYLCFSRKFRLTFRQILPTAVPSSLTPSNPPPYGNASAAGLATGALQPQSKMAPQFCPLTSLLYLVILFVLGVHGFYGFTFTNLACCCALGRDGPLQKVIQYVQ